ncbi:putative hydrogenase maturation factor, HypE [Mycobacterium xenopi 3993]|nr:putative hydrogenase maturation factor, HypE [Mycobacterium xenopi 3993]
MTGAVPQWISAAFVLEEGFPIAELKEIVADMAAAAAETAVQIVTGTPRWCPTGQQTACSSRRPASALFPRVVGCPRNRSVPATRCCCRDQWAITAWR